MLINTVQLNKFLLVIALIISPTTPAFAGKLSITHGSEYEVVESGDDEWKHKLGLKYGFNDRWQLSIKGEADNEESREYEYDETEVKLKYNLWKSGDFKTSIEGGYEFDHTSGADAVLLNTQAKYGPKPWKYDIKAKLKHEVGDNRNNGLDVEIETKTAYELENDVVVGIKYDADFGRVTDNTGFDEQEHLLGPFVDFSIPLPNDKKLGTKLSYSAGLSDASPIHTFKYDLGYKF